MLFIIGLKRAYFMLFLRKSIFIGSKRVLQKFSLTFCFSFRWGELFNGKLNYEKNNKFVDK